MTLPAQDTFTAASNVALQTYSSNWTINAGAFSVDATGDYCYPVSLGNECAAHWNADTFGADQYSQGKITNTNNDAWIGVAVRCSASGANYYMLYWSPNYTGGSLYLGKVVSGAWTEIAHVDSYAVAAGDVLRLEVTGTTLTPKHNGNVVAAIGAKTDSSLSSGYAGISGYDNSSAARIDDWEGGNLGVSGVSGSASVTLGGLTAGGAGVVGVAGAASLSLGGLTVSAAGTAASSGDNGAASITLGALTAASAGTVAVRGAAAIGLGGLTAAASGAAAVAGAANIALGAVAVSANGYRLTGACAGGVLRVDPTNGRYFRNDSGPLLLSGFHTWASIQDSWPTQPVQPLDFDEYLAALISYGCNFTKAWFLETARDWEDSVQYFTPLPWARTGPGTAADGLPKFNLATFNQAYFDRLRERVIRAGNAGIYVDVMLFQGWSIARPNGMTTGNPWLYHPFNSANNINGVNGDANSDGSGYETRDSSNATIFNLQKAYVAKVIDTLNDLDNIFYEIANEEATGSLTWQQALVSYIRTYEGGKAKQHPVGITVPYPGGNNAALYAISSIDWLSPNGDYTPDAASTAKISLFDTDHITGLTAEYKWIFRALCQGHNLAYMDEWAGETYNHDTRSNATYQRIRATLGYALAIAGQIDLAGAAPQGGLSSTGYCLAKTSGAAQIVAYQDGSGAFTVNLTSVPGVFSLQWLRTLNGATQAGGSVNGGAVRTLTPPWAGEDAVALLELSGTDGAASITLGLLTVVAAGAVAAAGDASLSLGALSVAAAAGVATQGQSGRTLGAASLAGAGAVAVVGTAQAALLAITLDGQGVAGEQPNIGSASIVLGALSVQAAGAAAAAGALAVTLGPAAASAAGGVAVAGSASVGVAAITVVASGSDEELPEISGAANISLNAITVTAAGFVALIAVLGRITGPGGSGGVSGPRANATIGA